MRISASLPSPASTDARSGMQSLDSGMLLLDVAIGRRMVIIGQVLIVAVVFDVLYRRRFGEK